MMPVLGIFIAAQDPYQHRGILTILIVFSLLMAGTYIFLIQTLAFPVREYINVGLCVLSAMILLLLYPRGLLTKIQPN
jgi:hypothetical protein